MQLCMNISTPPVMSDYLLEVNSTTYVSMAFM